VANERAVRLVRNDGRIMISYRMKN